MQLYKLADILPDLDLLDSYLTYRYIEDWCTSNITKGRWKFDHSSTICAHGVDIPGRIFFWSDEEAAKFRSQYRVISPDPST
jgi:hypothetical protein